MIKTFNKNFNNFITKKLLNYEYVYLTTDFRGFIKKYNIKNPNQLCEAVILLLLKHKKTIIIPTYSYTSKGNFFVNKTPSNLGYLSKWAINQKKYFRTTHPIFSFCIIGSKVSIFKDTGKSAFGKKSVWEKLLKNKSSLLHVGRPFSLGNTITHFVEQKVGAKYRFFKYFRTKVYNKKKYLGDNFSAFVSKIKHKKKLFQTNTKKISKFIMKQPFYQNTGNDENLTNFTHIDYKKAFNFMCTQFKKNKEIFINYI